MLNPKIVDLPEDVPNFARVEGLYVFAREAKNNDGTPGVFYVYLKGVFVPIQFPGTCPHCGRGGL